MDLKVVTFLLETLEKNSNFRNCHSRIKIGLSKSLFSLTHFTKFNQNLKKKIQVIQDLKFYQHEI